MSQIKSTTDYSIFKTMDGNRHLTKFHIRKMVRALQADNQLSVHPIIINKDFYVIDGQHRLEAAKILGLEVFYVQSDTITERHVIDANVNQRSYEVENYIDYFSIKERNSTYIQIKEMLKSTGLKPKALLTLLIGVVSTNILELLKTGKFQLPSGEDPNKVLGFYSDFISYAKDKRIKPISMFTNHNFTRALRWLFKTEGFDSSIFFKKLDLRWFDLKPQRISEEWYALLLNIYNFKNHNRIESNENI